MSTKRVFTKSFFRLTPSDQALVVDATLHDLEMAVGCTPADQAALRRTIRRIEKKACDFAIYGAEETAGAGGEER